MLFARCVVLCVVCLALDALVPLVFYCLGFALAVLCLLVAFIFVVCVLVHM